MGEASSGVPLVQASWLPGEMPSSALHDLTLTALPEMRTGRTLGRTLYLRTGGEDWKADQCIGIVDTPELAEAIVAAVNAMRERSTAGG